MVARRGRRWALLAAALIVAGAALGAWLSSRAQRARLVQQMMSAYPDKVTDNRAVVQLALAQARPLFAQYCARCHGTDMRGNPAIGASNLTNDVWLWGNGSVFQIERILLYGIRSGQPQSLHVTVMPAFGVMGRLSDAQVRDLVQYLLKLNHRPYQVGAANTGEQLFHSDSYGCYDCHSADARGDPDYGAPNLTIDVWNNGGDPKSLYDSIYYGRDRVMPAWKGILSLEQMRALAIYIHVVSHAHPQG
ncbi:MAG TPA: c-type cytochrome [Steroidobacteraceae bacterium]|nr:c-type cytochrome [Steroidobacteraceae bacterium]